MPAFKMEVRLPPLTATLALAGLSKAALYVLGVVVLMGWGIVRDGRKQTLAREKAVDALTRAFADSPSLLQEGAYRTPGSPT